MSDTKECHCHDDKSTCQEHEHDHCTCDEHRDKHDKKLIPNPSSLIPKSESKEEGDCCHKSVHEDDCDDDCCCCGGHVDTSKVPEKGLTVEQRKGLIKIGAALVFLLLTKLLEPHFQVFLESVVGLPTVMAAMAAYVTNIVFYGANYMYIGRKVLKKAFRNICKGEVFDENFLMVVATLGAIFMGLMGDGEFTEAVAVMIFYQLGEWFEDYAVGRSRKNIADLMDIRPDYANIEVRGKLKRVDPETLQVGAVIVVQPGEKIPIDGVVLEGASALDTSALTGESVPRTAKEGDEVVSGCICSSGVLKIKTTKHFSESTVSKILTLVENASERKSQSEAFITRFAKYYTPIVCFAALALAIIPPIAIMCVGQEADWMDWVYRALIFLVISCPCALVISIPLSFFAGIGCASKNGVLVKGSNYLEALSKIDTLMFDKTGTLTQGVFQVTAIAVEDKKLLEETNPLSLVPNPSNAHLSLDENQSILLTFAAYCESASSHPIAKSIVAACGDEIDRDEITDQTESSANGVSCKVFGHKVSVGKLAFVCETEGHASEPPKQGGSTVYVSVDEKLAGSITVSDVVKDTSAEAISALKAVGVKKTVMLTGDNEASAEFMAAMIGVDEVHANLLPEDKVHEVEKVQEKLKDQKKVVGFVGDGINDAPVLMRADVGIAMGAMGSDAAIEAADVVLMDDNPLSIAKSVGISRKAMRIVRENIVFALGIKSVCLILGAVGLANMYLAIFADVGVMVIAVLNAMRALRIRR